MNTFANHDRSRSDNYFENVQKSSLSARNLSKIFLYNKKEINNNFNPLI